MTLVMVVDDMALIREPIAAALQGAGYETVSAANGQQALTLAQSRTPDLIILDLSMPVMDGMTVLQSLRAAPATAKTPVILLTSSADKDKVVHAAKLGIQGYFLKSQFSLAQLLDRVSKHVARAPVAGTSGPPSPAGVPSPVAAPKAAGNARKATVQSSAVPIPKLLTREDCVRRTQEVLGSKTLSGVVAQVIAMAASPRTDTSQLAELIVRDSMLSVRVLQAANSAAYASSRGLVSTIPDAIRNIGLTTVRNIAAAMGIFEAMPETQPDGFNPIRCWQHSFAAAQLCERLQAMADPDHAGVAYLVGLCHDLGEILFHTHFGAEYRHVLDLEATTGKHRAELETQVLGMTHGQLALTILQQIGLPEIIRAPIEAMHRAAGQTALQDPLARLLAVAELYANGALLASSAASPVAPITQAICKSVTGNPNPAAPDVAAIRNEVFSLTALLARLSTSDEQQLMKPLYDRQDVRILLVRDRAFSTFDPVETALGSMADVQVSNANPTPEQLAASDALVAISGPSDSGSVGGVQIRDWLRRSGKGDAQLLWLSETGNEMDNDLQSATLPVTLQAIADFIHAAAQRKLVNPTSPVNA